MELGDNVSEPAGYNFGKISREENLTTTIIVPEEEIQPGATCISRGCRRAMSPNWDETPVNGHHTMPGYVIFGKNGTSRALLGYACLCGRYISAKMLIP